MTAWQLDANTAAALEHARGGGRLVVSKHGRPAAALVPVRDLMRLLKLEAREARRERARAARILELNLNRGAGQ